MDTSVANDRSRRLLESQSSACCREVIASLVCQLAVGICAEEAIRGFSCGYVHKTVADPAWTVGGG